MKKKSKVIDDLLNFIGTKKTKGPPDQMMERIGRFYGRYLVAGIVIAVAVGFLSLIVWLISRIF